MNPELRRRTDDLVATLPSFETLFDIPNKISERNRLTAKMGEPNFWDSNENAQNTIQVLKPLNAS